jgi:hypothetical protein
MSGRKKEEIMNMLGYGDEIMRVPFPESTRENLCAVFNSDFMKKYTNCESFEEFMFSSAVFVNWDSALLVYSKKQFDAFVSETTSFGTWRAMLEKGGEVYSAK